MAVLLQATFEDELVEDALAKRHSLTCEAVQIGAKVPLPAPLLAPVLLDLLLTPSMQRVLLRLAVAPLLGPLASAAQTCLQLAGHICGPLKLDDCCVVQSGAYRTILTHFSQRYPKIPKIEKSFLATTCIAFDLMSVNLKGMSSHELMMMQKPSSLVTRADPYLTSGFLHDHKLSTAL